MKKRFAISMFIFLLAGSALYANPKIFKPHKGLTGKDTVRVNCAYCHTKAGIPKKKAADKTAYLKDPYCAIEGCHAQPKQP
ncbi:MAG: hypothetical protein QNJ97_05875 [Myxococcota bacterium]|nr:hypothetical protein [Myxococcota bacterium]